MKATEYKEAIAKAKELQKALAAEIREGRKQRRRMYNASDKYRYQHLAYCLVRGTSLRAVEATNDQSNRPWRTGIAKAIRDLFGDEVSAYCKPYITGTTTRIEAGEDIVIPRMPREVDNEVVHARAS